MEQSLPKRALILGVGGQDGSFLADYLLQLGYQVHGLHRRTSSDNLWRLGEIKSQVTLHRGDLCDALSIDRVIRQVCPHEIYNCADQDHVDWSLSLAGYNMDVTARAVVQLLDIVHKFSKVWPLVKVFQPLSATMFGSAPPPQNEATPLAPQSPYAIAKVAAWFACQHYRREYGVHVSTAILFNHESPRRGEGYLLHRICKRAVEIGLGQESELPLFDPSQRVDIGYAGEYVEGMHRILQHPTAGDWVVGTGIGLTVREMAETALEWEGVENPGSVLVEDTSFVRPGVAPTLIADTRKLQNDIRWVPSFTVTSVIQALCHHYKQKLTGRGSC